MDLSKALITLEEAAVYLDKPFGGSSDRTETLILDCSEELKSIFKRRIVSEGTITEYHWAKGCQSELLVNEYPILAIASIHEDTGSTKTYGDSSLLVEGTDFVVDKGQGCITRISNGVPTTWSSGFEDIRIVYTGGYAQPDVPRDVKQLCAELVELKYKAIEREQGNLVSVSDGMGTRSFVAPADLTSRMRERAARHRRFDLAGARTWTRFEVAA